MDLIMVIGLALLIALSSASTKVVKRIVRKIRAKQRRTTETAMPTEGESTATSLHTPQAASQPTLLRTSQPKALRTSPPPATGEPNRSSIFIPPNTTPMSGNRVSNTVVTNFGAYSAEASGAVGKPGGTTQSLRDQMAIDGVTSLGIDDPNSAVIEQRESLQQSRTYGQAKIDGRSRRALARVNALPPLKKAIVWSEILSPPVSERELR